MSKPVDSDSFTTPGGVLVRCRTAPETYENARMILVDKLDGRRGVLLSSDFEYPGRYTRWDMGFVDPPLELSAAGRSARVAALCERGRVLAGALARCLPEWDFVEDYAIDEDGFDVEIREPAGRFPEEERSRQPSVFSLVRAILAFLRAPERERFLGLYGAFGYNLAFQFEPLERKSNRDDGQRDLVLYLPDRLLAVDHQRGEATWRSWEFEIDGETTEGMARGGPDEPFRFAPSGEGGCDHAPGDYAETVRKAKERFRAGDLFETVPGVDTRRPVAEPPSVVFRRLMRANPAPYGFFINLGRQEYLVGASPEMFVRVEGRRVETCPISGTIRRGADPIADAGQIRALLNSEKDESELTMCTDVDRNDKSRICEPGSVRVIGRRHIEMYSRLIHTVDHVEGTLRAGFDALDAFLSHTWAVTVTGAPKKWAMQFIEDHERSPRRWYGGAVGAAFANGNMNTGLTLRTIQFREGVASVRAGATLLHESDPAEEEDEIGVKASAFLDAIAGDAPAVPAGDAGGEEGRGLDVLLVDHEDSFVHTLADYFRQTGAEVETLRFGFAHDVLDERRPGLAVLSPGPGEPRDFGVAETVGACVARGIPVFGVCLGLQGIAEHFGARLRILDTPVHGKPSEIEAASGALFEGLPRRYSVGRYHSIHVRRDEAPDALEVLAWTADGVTMALRHRTLPVWAVQFHPESILGLEAGRGLALIRNVVALARAAAG